MSTPALIHIIADCGLEIETDTSTFHGLDRTNSKKPWKYKVTNSDLICPRNSELAARQEDLVGWLSPFSRITLLPLSKRKAGMPENAASYAFMYPPQGLAEILLFERDHQDNDDSYHINPEILRPIIDRKAIESAALLGGFAYFDKNCDFICVNALSTQKTERSLNFSGPFETKPCVCRELHELRRSCPLQLDTFHEVGFVSYAWVRPCETFNFRSVFTVEGPTNSNGTMIFFRENGTGVAYVVDKSNYVDPNGYVGIISEAVRKISKAKFTQQVIQPINEVNAWGARFNHFTKSMTTADHINALKDKRRFIHMACHAGLGHTFISDVLETGVEEQNLSYQDSLGWNPLHYACCFSPNDCILIKLLATKCPEAVVQFDIYDRSPLHIACNSNTSEEVIAALLEADSYIPKVTINKKTRRFGLLPLHLACFNGAKESIINALLDADYDNRTAVHRSSGGLLPLHLAILKKLPASMVKTFLDGDLMLSSGTLKLDSDIYQTFDGQLPLHLACYNNSPSEIVQLLLEKDERNATVNVNVCTETCYEHSKSVRRLTFEGPSPMQHLFNKPHLAKSLKIAFSKSVSALLLSGEVEEHGNGVVAIHLAMAHGSTKVISLLLQKEVEQGKGKVRVSMVHKRDGLGRIPLHIACQYNVGPHIIQDLLDLDPFKCTTQFIDRQGFMPLHYACENKDTSAETINILIDAEEQYLEKKLNEDVIKRRSTHTGDIGRKRTPLYLAVKSGIKAECFERLLQPENFLLKGFDNPAVADLAEVVNNNPVVQAKVIGRLTERTYFFALILESYACIAATVFFIAGSVRYTEKELTMAYPVFLAVSTSVFIFRELLQILSVGTEYIGDVWSWFEIVNIVLLLITSNIFREVVADPSKKMGDNAQRILFATTGFFVMLQFIFYLRNTFIQFARFVGGLLKILKTLIPFLVVSLLLIWAFIYAFWILDNNSDMRCLSSDSLWGCFLSRFQTIFNFSPRGDNPVEVVFAILIIIVLLNVLIAIVSEAWTYSAQKSNVLFWHYRLQKIYELRYALKLRTRAGTSFTTFPSICYICSVLSTKIDNVRNISYGGHISWTRAPYHVLTKADHYHNPHRYFGPDQVKIINDAHSLQADMYWAAIDDDLGLYRKSIILLKWLCSLLIYVVLIILGFPTFGILWPKKFRAGVLTLGIHNNRPLHNAVPKSATKEYEQMTVKHPRVQSKKTAQET